MDKKIAHEKELAQLIDEAPYVSPFAGTKVRLPSGLVYYHELNEVEAAAEGNNLLDLQSRQDSLPLFSRKAQSMMGVFSSGRGGGSAADS